MYNRVAIAYGDGIGPEIMESVLAVFRAVELNLSIDIVEVGEKLYSRGFDSGIAPSAWETVLNNKILLKAPITTPFGGGYKSLNVTFRKGLGLYANVRPLRSFSPFVKSYSDKADVVVIRENEEDLYAGIEYRLSNNTYQSLKLVSRLGCEKIIKYAFDYAIANNRRKVTCCVKDNIMKMTDGLFSSVFDEIAKSYPSIETNKIIVDIGTARMAKYPEDFDVIFFGSSFNIFNLDKSNLSKTIKIKNNIYKKTPAKTRCVDGYVVKKEFAKKLYEEIKEIVLPFDFELNYFFNKLNTNCYWLEPGLVKQGSMTGVYKSANR